MINPKVKASELKKYEKRQQQKKKTAPARAQKSKKSAQTAKKSFAPAPVGKATNKCVVPPPPKPAPIPPKPPTVVRKNCSLIRIDTVCEHKERRAQDNLLEVVPTTSFSVATSLGTVWEAGNKNQKVSKGFEISTTQGDDNKGDNLSLKAEMHQNCGSHPIWIIKDDKNNVIKKHTGEKVSFDALPPEITEDSAPDIIGILWWLKDIKPREYISECADHHGVSTKTNIYVYPVIESGFSIKIGSAEQTDKEGEKKANSIRRDLSKYAKKKKYDWNKYNDWDNRIENLRKRLQDGEVFIKKFVVGIEDLEAKYLEGSISAKNTWAEEESSHRAYWEAEIAFNLEPLLALGGKLRISPTFIPPWINKWVDAYFYIGFQGEITAKALLKWKKGNYNQGGGSLTGAITVTLGAKTFVGKEYKVISIECNGGTKFTFEGSLIGVVDPQITLEGKIKWDPAIAKVVIQAFDGNITLIKKEWTFFEQKELWSGSHKFLS